VNADHREALFDLAVERAASYLLRARTAPQHDAPAIRTALEVWYLKTRFASRVPLAAVVTALLKRPPGANWRWRGGPGGAWRRD
jgi:hypothetical protein